MGNRHKDHTSGMWMNAAQILPAVRYRFIRDMVREQEKKEQEEASLKAIKDAFKRVVILRDDIMPYHDDNGFLIIGLIDFLLNPNSLDM